MSFLSSFALNPPRIAELITIVAVVLLVLYVFYRLNFFKKD
jgi:hypothetical protein